MTFSNELWLRFNGPGGAFSCSTGLGVTNYNLASYNVIATNAAMDIHVRGQYNGSVTVVSDDDLYIENNITRVNNATDYLGLMAADDKISFRQVYQLNHILQVS